MNKLVFKNKDQVLTTSRNVARDFDREHRNITRGIESLLKNEHTPKDCFIESTYEHPVNRQIYKEYLINKDGFTLLVMGFTGNVAMKFKVSYMKAFNEMEKQLSKPRALSAKEQLKASMRLSLETSEEVEVIKKDVNMLKDTMRIDGRQEHKLQKTGRNKVVSVLGGKDSAAYKEMSRSVFQMFWNEFKDYFMIPRYNELPKKDFEDALNFIDAWQPRTKTRLEIDSFNKQTGLVFS